MFVFVQLVLDVPRHGNVESSVAVLPVEFNTAVQVACPVFDEFIFLADAFDEVVSVFLANVFDAKIVNDKRESDRVPFMLPEPRRVFAFVITVRGKSFK